MAARSGQRTAQRESETFGAFTLLDRIDVTDSVEVFHATRTEARLVLARWRSDAEAGRARATGWLQGAADCPTPAHRNVARVVETGQLYDAPYVALAGVQGVTLRRLGAWLSHNARALDTPLAVFVGRELLAGVEAARRARLEAGHDRPLGLRASNVLCSAAGDVQVLGWDPAFAWHDGAGTEAMRRLRYLAPEQLGQRAADGRADVFSSALVVLELLLGEPWYRGRSELQLLIGLRRNAPAGRAGELLQATPQVCGALEHALQAEPARRAADTQALQDALSHAVTFDEGAFRAELGALVRQALDDASPDERRPSTRPAPPRKTVAPPVLPSPEWHLALHQVRGADGTLRGPFRYSELVEAIATGKVRADDRISLAGRAFRPVSELPEFERYLPVARLRAQRDMPACTAEYDDGITSALTRSVLQGFDGLLVCERDTVGKEVYFVSGVPVSITSGLSHELLGEYLVRTSVIDRGELDMALALLPRYEGRLGDTLIALGLVDPRELFRVIERHALSRLMDLFTWNEGRARLFAGVAPPSEGFVLDLDPWAFLDEGFERRLDRGLEPQLAHPTRRLRRDEPLAARLLERTELPPHVRAILEALERPVTLKQLGALVGERATARTVERSVAILLHGGVAYRA